MTRDEALKFIANRFVEEEDARDEPWWHPQDGEEYAELFNQLVDDHGLTFDAALQILGAAHYATANEYGE